MESQRIERMYRSVDAKISLIILTDKINMKTPADEVKISIKLMKMVFLVIILCKCF